MKRLILLLLVACTSVDLPDTASDILGAPSIRSLSYGDKPEQIMDVIRVGADVQPVIIIVHGDAWVGNGHKENVRGAAKLFVNNGYTVVTPDYRLMSDHAYPASESDIACVIATVYARANKLQVDKDNIILLGYADGTYAAAQVAYNFEGKLLEDCLYKTFEIKRFIGLDGTDYFSVRNMLDLFNQSVDRDNYYGLNIVESSYDTVSYDSVPAYFLITNNGTVIENEMVKVMHDHCVDVGLKSDFHRIEHDGGLNNPLTRESVLEYVGGISQ